MNKKLIIGIIVVVIVAFAFLMLSKQTQAQPTWQFTSRCPLVNTTGGNETESIQHTFTSSTEFNTELNKYQQLSNCQVVSIINGK